ncbi:MAG: hypothetical protein IT184_10465 [Acidobacteria bacterium]|nr:hypothetical protein [Acidobacteriota bacterium]
MTPPDLQGLTLAERRLIRRLRTPRDVQRFLNLLPYNTEPPPEPATLRSFRGVVARRTANCIEAALTAAVVLEQHGYPPLVMSLESIDALDHVVFVYRRGGRWGSVAKSRDPGLHGRRPVFRTLRALARSYMDPYIDRTGMVTAYGVVDLNVLGRYEWRLSSRNVWRVERLLFEIPHHRLPSSRQRVARLRRQYVEYVERHAGQKPLYYDRSAWTAIPTYFTQTREMNGRSG